MFGESKVATMVEKFGVPVVLTYLGADYIAKGIKDENDEELMQTDTRSFAGRVTALTVRTSDFPEAGLVEGGVLLVDDEDYVILSAHRREDGAITRVLCART